MKKITLILLVVLGLALATVLGLALRGFVGDTILVPILFVAWLAQLIISSVPGWVWWAWFVIIAIVIAQRSLRVRLRVTERHHEGRVPVTGPVQAWARRLVTTRSHNDYFRWLVARDLADLALRCAAHGDIGDTAYRERDGEARVGRNADLTDLHAPPEIASYLRAGLETPPSGPVGPLVRIPRPWRSKRELSPLALDPEKVVTFLEGQLEGRYDD